MAACALLPPGPGHRELRQEHGAPDAAPARASLADGPRHHTMQDAPSARRWGAPGQVAFPGLPACMPPLTAWWLW